MLGIVFLLTFSLATSISSKLGDLNICAHTWHSVSVLGPKQGFELALPELTGWINIIFQV